jgi:hypothetical protein
MKRFHLLVIMALGYLSFGFCAAADAAQKAHVSVSEIAALPDFDAHIYEVDLSNGNRTSVAAFPDLRSFNLAAASDTSLILWLGSSDRQRLARLDLPGGAVTTISETAGTIPVVGAGPIIRTAQDIVVDHRGRIWVLDAESVLKVNPATGDRTRISGRDFGSSEPSVGSGPEFVWPQRMAMEADGSLLVTERSLDGPSVVRGPLLRINPRTGDRTVVSDDSTGAGPLFQNLHGVAVEPNGAIAVTDLSLGGGQVPRILRVDPVSGDRLIVSDETTGAGPVWGMSPLQIEVETNGSLLIAQPYVLGSVQ